MEIIRRNSECATTVDGFAPTPAVEKRSEPSANSSRVVRWTDMLAVLEKRGTSDPVVEFDLTTAVES